MKVLKEMNDEKKFAKVVFTCPATDKYLFTLARKRGGGEESMSYGRILPFFNA
jgi:hypothetical protein